LGGAISFCYIDGNHSYDFAKLDFENCDRFLEKGGFMLFDDSADGSDWDVCKVVQEVIATGRYDLIAKNPNYFFRRK
jgi:Methyltransferase domain